MHIHNVFFWLKEDQDTTAFEDGLKKLSLDPAVHTGFFGKPAAVPDRPVVDSSYSYSLVLIFNNIDDHDQYQIGPLHHKFLEDHKGKWHKIAVFDIDTR